jgi:hypothetical protein
MSKTKTLSYKIEDIMKYQEINNKLPSELLSLCVNDINNNIPQLNQYINQLDEIELSTSKGIDSNNITFRNLIKYYVNTINGSNYDEFLGKLQSLNYKTKENIQFLISELIMGAIRCQISVKGFSFTEDNIQKTIPEICSDVIRYFSQLSSEAENGEMIDIHNEITDIFQQYFLNFIDITKSMDENNENTSDNYKGFMTFMGLLYSRNVINTKTVLNCINIIKRTIYSSICKSNLHCYDCNCCEYTRIQSSDINLTNAICYYDCNICQNNTNEKLITHRKHVECVNIHRGYIHLISHVVRSLDIRSNELLKSLIIAQNIKLELENTNDEKAEKSKSHSTILNIIEKLSKSVELMIEHHQEIINFNKLYISINYTKYVSPLKQHSIITHNEIGNLLNLLQNKLSEYLNYSPKKYIDIPYSKI